MVVFVLSAIVVGLAGVGVDLHLTTVGGVLLSAMSADTVSGGVVIVSGGVYFFVAVLRAAVRKPTDPSAHVPLVLLTR